MNDVILVIANKLQIPAHLCSHLYCFESVILTARNTQKSFSNYRCGLATVGRVLTGDVGEGCSRFSVATLTSSYRKPQAQSS